MIRKFLEKLGVLKPKVTITGGTLLSISSAATGRCDPPCAKCTCPQPETTLESVVEATDVTPVEPAKVAEMYKKDEVVVEEKKKKAKKAPAKKTPAPAKKTPPKKKAVKKS